MPYRLLPEFIQDSPEWHEARRATLGASEVAAILGLSKWQTPLTVWKAKQGIPNEIPEDLAYFGHALEPVIAGWVADKHPEVGPVGPGLSVQSVEFPWLSASPDRAVHFGDDGIILLPERSEPLTPIELKTASAYTKDDWADGVPDYYRIQSIVQQGILGAPFGWLAVLHGGNTPALYKVPFEPQVWEQIVRITGEWWETHIVGGVAPEPVSTAEAVELWPGNPEITVEGTEALYELWGAYGNMQAEAVELQEQMDAVKLELQKAMQDAVALTYQGIELFTWKPRKGAARLDAAALKDEMPTIHAHYLRAGAPTRTFLRKTTKEVNA